MSRVRSSTGAVCPRCGEPMLAHDRFCIRCGASRDDRGAAVGVAPVATWDTMRALQDATAGQYQVVGEVGRGGMAIVYLAEDVSLCRRVALKVMAPALLMDGAAVTRFQREARTAAQLDHPHIIPIYRVHDSDQLAFFVMKFVDGGTLEFILGRAGALPIPMAQFILGQVGAALGYAHRRGVVHRDVKPANVLIDREGWVVVTDFGIAKVAEASGLTLAGTPVGTPSYMSPEQCLARAVTPASDQYGLGAVAYEMVTGTPPFVSDVTMNVMLAQVQDTPDEPMTRRPDCPPELSRAIMRMLSKEPAHRFPSMEDAVAALGGEPLPLGHPIRSRLLALVADAATVRAAGIAAAPPARAPATQ